MNIKFFAQFTFSMLLLQTLMSNRQCQFCLQMPSTHLTSLMDPSVPKSDFKGDELRGYLSLLEKKKQRMIDRKKQLVDFLRAKKEVIRRGRSDVQVS
jgi:hypothetical protein